LKRKPSICLSFAAGLFLYGSLLSPLTVAAPLRFALVAKQVDHPFFIQVGKGCAEAARLEGNTCLLLGPSGTAHFRQQNEVLEQAIGMKMDGIALAVSNSKWLAEHALQKLGNTPLITFDSDLQPPEQHLRRGYVGLDNLAFGHELGMLAQHLRPQGGKLCVLSGNPQDTSYQERLQGIRQQLHDDHSEDGSTPLKGENGWSELERCPLYNADNPRNTLIQLATLLTSSQADVIISLGGWPIYRPGAYRKKIGPLLASPNQTGHPPTIVIPTPDLDSAQRTLLKDGLVHAFLNRGGRQVGRQIYWMIKHLAQGEPIPEKLLIDSLVERNP